MILTGRKNVIQVEQDIPASVLVRVHVLGPLEVSKRDQSGTWKLVPKDTWKNSKPARSILKRLLVQPGRRLSREQLADDVWSESGAEPDVYNAISLVRGVIGKSLVWTDLDASEALLKEAENRGHRSIVAFPLLEQALTLLERGELLEGEYGTWCHAFRKRAEDMLRQTRLWLAESYETQGKLWQAGEQYRAMILTDPSDEEALQCWLEMLVRQGKRREALKCYQEMKDFVEAQGFPLSPEIERDVASLEKPLSQVPTLVQRVSPLIQDIIVPKPVMLENLIVSENLSDLPFLQAIKNAQEYASLISLEEFFLQCEGCIKVCWHAMNNKGLSLVEETLLSYTPPLLSFALRHSKYQKTAARLLTHIHFLQAVITKHRLDFAARELHCLQAVQCSRIAEDTVLEAASLMYLAYTYIYCSPLRPAKAIETFLFTLPLLTQDKSLLLSDIYIGLADAYALCKKEKKALESIVLAHKYLPAQPEQDNSFLYAGCSIQVLHQYEGKMYIDLAAHDVNRAYYQRAWEIFAQSMKMDAISDRSVNETLLYQAEAACGLKDLDLYTDSLSKGVQTAQELGSQQRYRQAYEIHQRIPGEWQNESKLQKLTQELFGQEKGDIRHGRRIYSDTHYHK
jgi:DNA-binding SARP family transcriptional activator